MPRSVADPLLNDAINVGGTLNMLVAARDAGVRRFVFASSSSVYGDDPAPPKVEGREGKPLSPYGVSKLVGEKYAQVFHVLYGLEAVCLRYFNVFGPRQDPTSQYAAAIPLFITRILRGERPTIYGDGEQSRDFIYVADVVRANLAAGIAGRGGEAINVACGDGMTVNALLDAVNAGLGTKIGPASAAPRPGDILHSLADIANARRLIGYGPGRPSADGLGDRRMV